MIESLDLDSKKLLNQLVQTVLVTQQENEHERLAVLATKRKIVQSMQKLEAERMHCEKIKQDLFHAQKSRNNNSMAVMATEEPRPSSALERSGVPRKKRSISVKRYKIESDGSKTLVSTRPLTLNESCAYVVRDKQTRRS